MNLYRHFISVFYPERCPFCNDLIEAKDVACEKCLRQLSENRRPIIRGAGGFRCVSSFPYEGNVRRMLIRIKFYERIQHIRQSAVFLADDVRTCYEGIDFDCITAVPMHPKDQKARGFNQCELLAQELSKLLGTPFQPTLEKIKRTRKQHHLKFRERRKNLAGAFRIIDKDSIKGKRILIVDDIVTTGNTLGACCKMLARAKPELICCATIANASLPESKKPMI